MKSTDSKGNSNASSSKQPNPDIYSEMVARREQLLVQLSQCRIREMELSEQQGSVAAQQEQTKQQLVALRGALAVLDEFLTKQKPLPNLESMDGDTAAQV